MVQLKYIKIKGGWMNKTGYLWHYEKKFKISIFHPLQKANIN